MIDMNKPDIDMAEIKGKLGRPVKTVLTIIIAILVLVMMNPFVIVGAGERGVVLNFGAVQGTVMGEGIHFRVPIMQKVVKIDVKVHKAETEAEAASKDLQDIRSTIAVNYHILADKANWVYQNIGTSFKERIIDPAVQEVVKAINARYNAVELITQREKVRDEIKSLLKQRLMNYNIVVDDFSIVNFKFTQQFEQAIEAKQTAEQLALKAQRDLERIKIEADQKIARQGRGRIPAPPERERYPPAYQTQADRGLDQGHREMGRAYAQGKLRGGALHRYEEPG
jgi:regulator of protease activity HflC (stomatin/prohibitin superfamily)